MIFIGLYSRIKYRHYHFHGVHVIRGLWNATMTSSSSFFQEEDGDLLEESSSFFYSLCLSGSLWMCKHAHLPDPAWKFFFLFFQKIKKRGRSENEMAPRRLPRCGMLEPLREREREKKKKTDSLGKKRRAAGYQPSQSCSDSLPHRVDNLNPLVPL